MTFRFERDKFFSGVRGWLGTLSPQQVNGLTFLIDSIERDPFLTRIEWPAYMLATTTLETAHTFQPIHEYGSRNYFIKRYGGQTALGRRLGNDTPEEGAIYAGVGDVQLTGEANYEKAEKALREQYPEIVADFETRTGRKFDLTVGDQPGDIDDPKNAGDPAIAYAIMSYGMRTGLFTGKSLQTYTKPAGFDSYNARRIINGLDHADIIAANYKEWLSILRNALIDTAAIASTDIDPAGSQDSPPSEPASETVGSPEPEADVSQLSAADGDGENQTEIMRTLRIGDTGDDVKALQKALKITADGDFGRNTRAAVIAFQAERNMRIDGIVGPATRKELDL